MYSNDAVFDDMSEAQGYKTAHIIYMLFRFLAFSLFRFSAFLLTSPSAKPNACVKLSVHVLQIFH
jgi:hypothetical protein